MELWIRSQNKHTLIKCNYVTTLVEKLYDTAIYSIVTENDLCLGTYDSEHRLLEVLDEIQKYINNNCKFIVQKTHTKMGTYTNKIDTYVYEMPEE